LKSDKVKTKKYESVVYSLVANNGMIITGHGNRTINIWNLGSNNVKTKKYRSGVGPLSIYDNIIITGHSNGNVNIIRL
jgi:hypothetical protein